MTAGTTMPSMAPDDDRPEKRFSYGNWLQPIINANDHSKDNSEIPAEIPSPPSANRRSRGRPRVTKPRNDSAAEKRRAQVREAQRTYQKRKDTATATEKRRVDELLQMLSDLSTDVETLLQAASKAGSMYRDDDVSKNIQRLWSTYDTVVNNRCVQPEFRLLQVRNSRRLATHQTNANFRIATVPGISQEEAEQGVVAPLRKSPIPFDPSAISFELVRFEATTVMSSFQRTAATSDYMAGRSIFDLVQERQAAMKEADRRLAED